ncbi:hypothetical protein TNCV_2474301 [Trichonephila clavipes]|nr:hypothetical protein TNCV_2474301 [Trichonephila clavipes]
MNKYTCTGCPSIIWTNFKRRCGEIKRIHICIATLSWNRLRSELVGVIHKSLVGNRPTERSMKRSANTELADMYFIYGLAEKNARSEERFYHERYPRTDASKCRMLSNLQHNLYEYGLLRGNMLSESGKRICLKESSMLRRLSNKIQVYLNESDYVIPASLPMLKT